jgi:hypothetical protein
MKADGLFVIVVIFFIFAAWVATGGPTRPISQAGPFLTPVQRPGEESQGYRYLVPTNPINTASYPTQVTGAGNTETISSGTDSYTPTSGTSGAALERSIIGPIASDANQEYIRIENNGTSPLTITGWLITSRATGAAVSIPTDPSGKAISIKSGESVTIGTGRSSFPAAFHQSLCESSSENCVFLNRSIEAYGNDTDTITLRNTKGVIVDTFSY